MAQCDLGFMWETKIVAAADAAAETNWKQKVTPDRGELIIEYLFYAILSFMHYSITMVEIKLELQSKTATVR